MKLNKKKLFLAATAISLIAILSLGTLAWFSDSDDVNNDFHIAVSTEDEDDIFSVDVRELVDNNGDGVGETVVDVDDVAEGKTYNNVKPGDTFVKQPYVVNTGAYDQWVRVKVTVDNVAAWTNMLSDCNISDLTDIFDGYNENLWTRYDVPVAGNDTLTYTFYMDNKLAPNGECILFTHVNMPEGMTRAHAAAFDDGTFSINVVAEAIQADHTGDNAYDAFDDCWPQ